MHGQVICNGEEVLVTSGTMESYTVDVWSGNHPFYTKSDQAMLSDEGRVSLKHSFHVSFHIKEMESLQP